jgi:hypothetical protein
MSTSGNTSWDLQSTAIVSAAYRKLGYLAEGQTLDPIPLANGVEALNAIVAYLETKGMPLWKRTTTTVAPSLTSQVYTVADAVKVAQVVLVNTGGAQYSLIEKSQYDFNALPTNGGPGVPVHYTVQPTLTTSTVSIWPLTSDATTVANVTLRIVYQKKFDGFFSAADTLDFPSYWLQGIILKLAVSLAPETGLPLQDRSQLMGMAEQAIKDASDYGDEDGSLYIQPDRMFRK